MESDIGYPGVSGHILKMDSASEKSQFNFGTIVDETSEIVVTDYLSSDQFCDTRLYRHPVEYPAVLLLFR